MSLVSIPAQQHPFGIDGQPMRFASPGISQIRPVWKALKRLFAATGTPADREYERLLESSGGKFTDFARAHRRASHERVALITDRDPGVDRLVVDPANNGNQVARGRAPGRMMSRGLP